MTAFMVAVDVGVGWRKKDSGQRESNPHDDPAMSVKSFLVQNEGLGQVEILKNVPDMAYFLTYSALFSIFFA
jgi:hypothetical protein